MTGPRQAADGKEAGALRTIGEVAEELGIRPHVLRYWEEQFPMLRPLKRSGGRRYYRPEDVALVARIDDLVHAQGFTLRGARLALTDRNQPAAPPASPPATSAVGQGSLPLLQEALAAGRAGAGSVRDRLVTLRERLASALD